MNIVAVVEAVFQEAKPDVGFRLFWGTILIAFLVALWRLVRLAGEKKSPNYREETEYPEIYGEEEEKR